jgi:hypothetical protein
MSPTAGGGRPLQYFIHDDFDALRMEISGSLAGTAARKAYDAWRRATFLVRRQLLFIDISYVTDVDEHGNAVLRAWQGHGVRIVGSSLMCPMNTIIAGNRACAERATIASAVRTPNHTENTGLHVHDETVQQVR